jgi:hypothetical protein
VTSDSNRLKKKNRFGPYAGGRPRARSARGESAAVAGEVDRRRRVSGVLERLEHGDGVGSEMLLVHVEHGIDERLRVPTARIAAKDDPYSTIRRSPRWYQTRCGTW